MEHESDPELSDEDNVGHASSVPGPLRLEGIKRKLDAGQRALSEFRRKVFATMVGSFVVCFAAGLIANFVCGTNHGEDGWSACAIKFVSGCAACARAIFLGLAPLPDDPVRTRIVLVVFLMVTGGQLGLHAWAVHSAGLSNGAGGIRSACVLPVKVLSICLLGVALAQASAARMQKLMWSALVINAMLRILIAIILGALRCANGDANAAVEFFSVPPFAVIVFVAWTPSVQHGVQGFLRRQYQNRKKRGAAIGVAALLGRRSMTEVLDQARARFHCIDLSQLDEADLADNRPNPALFSKASAVPLGACDAFISHSWHDDPGLKWKALQAWRARFVAQNGREPRVWIDKCCLDQANLDVDLPCLPIFMSGCNRLVVLFGTTYLSRLWCVVELFTFLQMELDTGVIDFERLCFRGSCNGEQSCPVEHPLLHFDVRNCECFDVADKKRLQRVIHAGFGSMSNFNIEVLRVVKASSLHPKV